MLGTIIGEKYRLERSIGTGGMGEVFEARHLVTGRAVAVKLLYEQPAVNEAVASDRFRHEAYAAGTLDAEHIVQVFDAGTDRDTCRRYLVMELLRGESLHTLIKRFGPLAPELAFSIVGQAALGLSKAHAAGIIHRDVKPANIFLSLEADEVVVKVLDFGIAKVLDLDDREAPVAMPAGAEVVGSPHYMSPEQAQGLPTLDHRSDLFSLGAVLYRLLTGQTPHPGADTLVRLMYAICTEPARPLSEVAPWVPPDMVAFVERAMAIPAKARFQSAGEMAHGIATIVGDLRISPADVGPLSDEQRAGLEPWVDRSGTAPQAGAGANARTWDQTLQGSVATRPDKGSLVTAVLGAIAMAVVLLAVMGLWRTRGLSASRAARAAASAPPVVAMAPVTPVGVASQAVPGAAESTTTHSVWVHVPAADNVLVDGQRTQPSPTGYVEVAGDLGSRHEIWVTAAGRVKTSQVVITPDGAFPDAIQFGDTAPAERVSSAAPKRRVVKREASPDAGHRDGAAAAIMDAAENARPRPVPREEPDDPLGSIKLPTERKPFDD